MEKVNNITNVTSITIGSKYSVTRVWSCRKSLLVSIFFRDLLHPAITEDISEERLHTAALNRTLVIVHNAGNSISHVSQIQSVPNWRGYRKIISLKVTSLTTIGYCRPMRTTSTDIQVAYNMMGNMKILITNPGQPDPALLSEKQYINLARKFSG